MILWVGFASPYAQIIVIYFTSIIMAHVKFSSGIGYSELRCHYRTCPGGAKHSCRCVQTSGPKGTSDRFKPNCNTAVYRCTTYPYQGKSWMAPCTLVCRPDDLTLDTTSTTRDVRRQLAAFTTGCTCLHTKFRYMPKDVEAQPGPPDL